ncbi:expressed unknown protein [Seminavis robusta]|uniref:Uncharacterized protein n=1 Tax=Seminavis robusta TaxID=568900 RepID=A0A9N8F5G7_9STRA|nr:expressed unknown protein [Seminavis robusta]|eukprot:Sro3341_g347000.1 n/a (350) ;mRNA; r:5023-6182
MESESNHKRELQERWTPNRLEKGIIKIKKPGPSLCGDDWVCNSNGDGATLSFVFWKHGKYYGLTVGHLFKAIGDTVLSFIKPPVDVGGDEEKKESEEEKEPKEEKEPVSLPVYVIGKVVSWSQSTDSVVFQFVDDIEVEPYKVKEAAGLTRDIHLPPLESVATGPPPPLAAKTLVGFGARRRGFHAKVAIPSMNRAKVGQTEVPDGVCITNAESRDRITYHGDCGTIFIDLDCNGIYFHHAGTQGEPWKSYGHPLWDVMRKHPQLGGTSETPEEYDVRDCGDRNVKESHILEPIPAANFNVHVVPGPPRQLDGGSLKWKGKVHVVPNPNSKKKKTNKETGSHHQVFLQQ